MAPVDAKGLIFSLSQKALWQGIQSQLFIDSQYASGFHLCITDINSLISGVGDGSLVIGLGWAEFEHLGKGSPGTPLGLG